ncbi:hypothetical protein [Actinomadura harenae]|uniref:Uncharacterized protein n=1 Tax=Actinomadura harenae TaxID=2483351 RepID=A0A3M2MCB9_9ACTN|nr:hypothetical protein [Actinomadura harenae]RMI47141.1 hypothetical protein EBO15_04450 [Actinomadura harenae]
MSHSHRSHRRRKKTTTGKLGLAGALTGALGIGAVAAVIIVLRPDAPGSPSMAGTGRDTSQNGSAPSGVPSGGPTPMSAPKAGRELSFTTPEGFGYTLAAVRSGTDRQPLSTSQAPKDGETYAYADYVLTNSQRRPKPLDFPADLFMPRDSVPSSARERCMPQPGVPDTMCTLPNHSEVTARIGDAKAPFAQDGDTVLPAGGSYIVRVASDLPVSDGTASRDLRLFVWDARFTSDRKGVEIPLP